MSQYAQEYEILGVDDPKYRVPDIPIPFEDDDVKALVAEKFGGVTGGLTQVPGFGGEVTFRQAMAVTDSMMSRAFQGTTAAKPFNEFRFFRGLNDTGMLAFNGASFTSLIIPEGIVTISSQSIRPNIPYVEIPSTVTLIGIYNFWYGASPSVIKIWATTPPSIDYSVNVSIRKILVPQSALSAYQQHAEWSKYGDIFEGF